MRGAPDPVSDPLDEMGIIPAYAGSTCAHVIQAFPSEDHPRVCREHDLADWYLGLVPGSSPRMRGAQLGQVPEVFAGGDHPRVCGEHLQADRSGAIA